jgi:hypothetical protein
VETIATVELTQITKPSLVLEQLGT